MSASVCERADDRKIELGTGVSWPPIVAAAGLTPVIEALPDAQFVPRLRFINGR